MNPDKGQYNQLPYKIEDLGGDKFRFSFGDDVEIMPADGKDHPTKFGSIWAITRESPTKWKLVIKRNGKVTVKEEFSLSDDGQTFTDSWDEMRPDGSAGYIDVKFKRTDSGGSGFAGNWESTEIKISSPTTLEIAKWQGDGYALSNAALKERLQFKLDGKDYVDKGPRVPAGMKISARKVDDRTIELTYKLKDKTTETDRLGAFRGWEDANEHRHVSRREQSRGGSLRSAVERRCDRNHHDDRTQVPHPVRSRARVRDETTQARHVSSTA